MTREPFDNLEQNPMTPVPIPDFGAAAKQAAMHAAAVLAKIQAEQPEVYEAALAAIGAGGVIEIVYLLDVDAARIGFAVRLPGGERVELAHVPVEIETPSASAH